MSASANIRAGAAYVELSVENSALVRGLKAAQKTLRGFATSVSGLGKRLTVASGVMATPLIAGAKVYADFEQQMANVSTMLAEPDRYMATFRDGIRAMSIEFGEGTDTLAKGLYDILSASVPPEKALGVLAASARAAKAGLSDTGTAADAVTTMLNAYGLGAERASDITDWLFRVVAKGKTTFNQLAPNIGKVATIASTAGISLDELGAVIATLTRNGVSTEQAMTAMSAIIASFLKPSTEGAQAARKLGFSLSAATLQSQGLHGVLAKLGSLPPDLLAEVFPNVEALRGILPAIKNLEGFEADIEAMRGRAGATGEAYGRMTSTLTHSFAQVRQAALGVLSVIGEALAEPLAKAAKAAVRYAGMLREVIQKNRGLVIAAAKVVAVVAALGGALIAVGSTAAVFAFAFGGLVSIASAVGTAVSVIGSVLGALLTPVGLISTAVVALGGYLVYASGLGGRALAWLSEQFAWLKDTARAAVKGIGDALAAGDLALAGRILWLSLKVVFQQGLQSLLGIWLDLKNGILEVWIGIKAGVLKTWQTLWFAVKEIAIRNGIAEPILEGFHMIEFGWLKVTQAMGRMWLELVALVFKAWNRVQSGIASAQQWIGEIAIDVMGYFDQSLDTEGAKKQLREDYAGQQQELADRRSAIDSVTEAERQGLAEQQRQETGALVARQGERLAQLQRQEAIGNRGRVDEMREAQAEVDRQAQAERTALESKAAADLKASGEALAQARAEWQAAIGEAARKRGAAQAEKRGTGPAGGIDDLIRRVQSAAPAVAEASGKAQVQGTFDTVALRALAAAGASDSVAANTAEMVRQQKRTNQKLDEQADIAPAFA